MRLLLDTHVLLWAALDDRRLSQHARQALADADNLYLSAISVLELAIKISAGRLDATMSSASLVTLSVQNLGLIELPVSVAHALRVAELPHIHGDPFDRLLVAQAQTEGLPLVTADSRIRRYDVETIW